MSDAGEKTEKATPQKMKKVREEGGIQKSSDLTSWVAMAGAAAIITSVAMTVMERGREQISATRMVVINPEPGLAAKQMGDGLSTIVWTLAPLLAVVLVLGVLANIAQGGVHPNPKALKPKAKNLNLVKGVKRVFGFQALWNGVKVLLKTTVVGLALYFVIISMESLLGLSGRLDLAQLLAAITEKIMLLLWVAIVAGIGLAILDVVVVMRKNRKQTRMSKQELKEENKNTEGNPEIKGAIRRKQHQMAQNRMMSQVADSDVVVVNPTHYAVALKYTPGEGAPKVLAKGVDFLALRIREKAEENGVPQVEDVMLARTLHAVCKLDRPIPPELYTAVAQVLAFVMLLKKRGESAGVHKLPETPGQN